MIFPPHSLHLTQPLDVGVFDALKKHMTKEIEPLMRTGISRIQKVEWLTAFIAAHNKAVVTKSILGGFQGTGIHPFLPTKVFHRVARSPSPESQPRPSTSPNLLTAINAVILTNSPADFNVVQQANAELNTLLKSGEPLPSPVKQYIRHCTRSIICLHAYNIILEQNNTGQKAILQACKCQLSGKGRLLIGNI